MIGVDTSFLVAFEIPLHESHESAMALAEQHSHDGFAVTTQVLSEFVHVVTDGRRFRQPIAPNDAVSRAHRWWSSGEIRRVHTDDKSVALFLEWMSAFSLGRKRVLDTLLAATYAAAEVPLIATTNWRDFGIYPGIHPLPV